MIRTRSVAKRQKTEKCTSCMESVLYSSDSLFKIASYLPADGLLNLALTCRRFGIAQSRSNVGGGDESLSLVEETARRVVHDVATEEHMNALPGYEGENWFSKYNYLQLLRAPLVFDQLVGQVGYEKKDKSRVFGWQGNIQWSTAFSNNIMMAGKHYVSFEVCKKGGLHVGVMRPGEAMQSASSNPLSSDFFNHFTQRNGSLPYNNSVNCCMYDTLTGSCLLSAWEGNSGREPWDGIERASGSLKIGMLLDLDEGTLSVYKDGRRLGVMKRGLAGHFCWVVSLTGGTQVTIKREAVPPS